MDAPKNIIAGLVGLKICIIQKGLQFWAKSYIRSSINNDFRPCPIYWIVWFLAYPRFTFKFWSDMVFPPVSYVTTLKSRVLTRVTN